MKTFLRPGVCGLFLAVGLIFVAQAAMGQPVLNIQTDKGAYAAGEDFQVSVSVSNPGTARPVDIHVAIIDPTSDIYEWPDWNTSLQPVLPDFIIPSGWDLPLIELFSESLSPNKPFQDGPGTYLVVMAFMEPGTFNLIGNLAFDTFTVSSSLSDPENIGFVFLSNLDSFSQGFQSTEVDAGGVFLDQIFEASDFDLKFASLGLDECQVVEWTSSFTGITLPKFLDAGPALQMSGVTLPKLQPNEGQFQSIAYQNDELTQADYEDNRDYTFSGPGGPDVGPFSVTVKAPPKVILSQPDLSTTLTVNKKQGLPLEWNAGSASSEVWVSVSTSEMNFSNGLATFYDCFCRVEDDGKFTIPADKLSKLPASSSSGFPNFDDLPNFDDFQDIGDLPTGGFGFGGATLDVSRTNWNSFPANGIESGLGVITSGVQGNIDLQ